MGDRGRCWPPSLSPGADCVRAGSGARWRGSSIFCETQGAEGTAHLGGHSSSVSLPLEETKLSHSARDSPCQGPSMRLQKIKPHSLPAPRKMGPRRFVGTPFRHMFMVFWGNFLQLWEP